MNDTYWIDQDKQQSDTHPNFAAACFRIRVRMNDGQENLTTIHYVLREFAEGAVQQLRAKYPDIAETEILLLPCDNDDADHR